MGFPGFLQQRRSPHDIGLGKSARIENRPIDMRFGRTINDGLRAVRVEERRDRGLIADVALHEGIPLVRFDLTQILKIARIAQCVKIDDLMAALR